MQKFGEKLLGDLAPSDVGADLVREWIVSLMDKGYAPNTVNRKLSSVRTYYKYLLKKGLVAADPLRRVTGPKKKKPLPVFLREGEVDRLLDDVDFGERFEGNNTLNFLDMWFAKPDVTNPSLSIDTGTGANGSNRSLKYIAEKVDNTWGVDLSYPLQGVNPGKYELSFYAKTNQTESPFITSITLCENNEDIAKEAKFQKAIVLQNGVQTIESGVNDIWGTVINQAGKEWKKYAVTVDIPTNVLVKFVFKLCAGANNQLTGYNATATDNVIYWFDDVSLKLVTE